MWRYVTVCDGMWRYVTVCDGMWRYVMVCDIMWRYVTVCDGMWRYVTVYDGMWRYVAVCDAMWHYVTACDSMWRYVTIGDNKILCNSSTIPHYTASNPKRPKSAQSHKHTPWNLPSPSVVTGNKYDSYVLCKIGKILRRDFSITIKKDICFIKKSDGLRVDSDIIG